jgi:protein-S-isoprenylcysteine O-methyltransferase Ste14
MRMSAVSKYLHSPAVNFLFSIIVATLWSIFVARHIDAYLTSGKWSLLVFCFSESLQALLFLIRRSPKQVSVDLFDWLVAIGGTAAPLFFVPGGVVISSVGEYLVIVAVVFQILGVLSLNRSLAVVAANRAIKTRGMYAFVRHPLYMSYFPLFFGYLIYNASPVNFVITVFAIALIFLRIEAEEKLLLNDQEYQAYAHKVRWRLLPFVY